MFKINTVAAIAVYVMLAAVWPGCHNITYKTPKVVSVSEGNKRYKYRIELEAFPVNQILYTNHLYAVGDTLTNLPLTIIYASVFNSLIISIY